MRAASGCKLTDFVTLRLGVIAVSSSRVLHFLVHCEIKKTQNVN